MTKNEPVSQTTIAWRQNFALLLGVAAATHFFLQIVGTAESSGIIMMFAFTAMFCFVYIFYLHQKEDESTGFIRPVFTDKVKLYAHLIAISVTLLQLIILRAGVPEKKWGGDFVAIFLIVSVFAFFLLVRDIHLWLKSRDDARIMNMNPDSSAGKLFLHPWNKTFRVYGWFLAFGTPVTYLVGFHSTHYALIATFLGALTAYITFIKMRDKAIKDELKANETY